MAKNTPPPSPPRWFFFEGKSTLGGDTVPDLSAGQTTKKVWLKLQAAMNGKKKSGDHTWSDLTKDSDFYKDIIYDLKNNVGFEFIKSEVKMTHKGALNGLINYISIL